VALAINGDIFSKYYNIFNGFKQALAPGRIRAAFSKYGHSFGIKNLRFHLLGIDPFVNHTFCTRRKNDQNL
jgi:hypothetical protein